MNIDKKTTTKRAEVWSGIEGGGKRPGLVEFHPLTKRCIAEGRKESECVDVWLS